MVVFRQSPVRNFAIGAVFHDLGVAVFLDWFFYPENFFAVAQGHDLLWPRF